MDRARRLRLILVGAGVVALLAIVFISLTSAGWEPILPPPTPIGSVPPTSGDNATFHTLDAGEFELAGTRFTARLDGFVQQDGTNAPYSVSLARDADGSARISGASLVVEGAAQGSVDYDRAGSATPCATQNATWVCTVQASASGGGGNATATLTLHAWKVAALGGWRQEDVILRFSFPVVRVGA